MSLNSTKASKSKIHAIIFDVGGVIVHNQDHSARHAWEERLGLPTGQLQSIVFASKAAAGAASGQVLESEVWKEVGCKVGLRDDQLIGLQRDFRSGERLDTELLQFVRSLRPHYKIGVISNAWSDARSSHNSKFKMDTWTDAAIYSAEVKLVKPDPQIYLLALDQLGTSSENCIFVDDSLVNVQAAQELGMKGVLCKNTIQTIDEINGYIHK